MEKLYFTEWGTVVLGDKEIKVEKFFSKLDRLIEKEEYSVKYKKEEKKFKIEYNEDKYVLELTDEQMSNMENIPNIKHLLYLSRIEDRAELKDSNIEISKNPLDDETKKFYLDILKKRKGKFTEYLENIFSDLEYSIENVHTNDPEGLLAIMLISGCFGTILGIAFGVDLAGRFANNYFILLFLSGLGLVGIEYVGCILKNYISERIFRLVKFIDNNKTRKARIKALEKELSMQKTLCIEDKQQEETKEVEITGSILLMINELIEELKEVNVNNRENIREEIRELLVEYMSSVNTTAKTDVELSEIIKKIAYLEIKVGLAKKKNNPKLE